MAKNQTLELSILIGGHVDNSLTQAVKSANTQLSSMANGASKLAANIAKVTVGIASGITAGLVDATKEAVAFESEMLDVTKYVGGLTDANGKVKTDAYAEMSKDILDLSTQIPYTAKELTRLAAAAGQSGKSMDDLISGGFLKDVAEMGTAMDISADQAGDWAAKWEVAFNMNHNQVMELADQINYLGAHYATTAAEIAQTVNDTGSLGQIAGMDVQSTAALSTALLAMGVDSDKVATSIRRMYTNLSMGSKATDAQSAAFEQLGFTAEQFAKDMQKDAPAALKSLFTAIGTQPKDKQVGYLKTLLGQWAIESGAKLTGNLDLFVKTLDDVGDASKYNGSMYKEFMLKCETSESVLTMLGSVWRAVRIEVGNNFLPVLKDVAGFGIEKLNDLRAALPDIAERVRQVIEYLLNNGDKVAATIAGIGTAWAGMRFAPQILQVVSSATKFASGAASPVGLVQKGVSGAGKAGNLWQAAKLGTQLANSAVPAGSNPSFGQRVQNTILGSVLGMQNSKKLFGAKTPAGMAKATSALFGSIQQAQASGGIIGLLKGSSIGQYGARVARSAKNLAGTDFIQNTVGVGKWIGQKVAGTQLGGFVGNMGQKAMGFGQGLLGGAKNIAGTAIGGVKNLAGRAASTKAGQFALKVGGGIAKGTGDTFKFLGSGLSLANTAVGPIAGKLGGAFMGLLGTFGPVITGIGGIIAVVSLLGDHFEDIRQIVGNVFGEKGLAMFDGFTSKIHDIAGNVRDSVSNAFSLENLQNIQQSLSGKSIFGIDDLGTTFGAVIPIIESVKGLIGQIVDLGVNHIKPLLADIMSFAVNELFPAVSPLISMIISLVGTTLINAIKLVVDVIHGLLPVIEPVIQGIVGLIKGIVSVTITVVNAIIGTLNKVSFTVPDWVHALGGKKFGFNLKEVAMPAFANGGFTHGVSIAGEAGTEAVISFKPSVHDSNVENWVRAGRMLGVSGEDATRAAGVRYFANGGFTDGSKEKLDNLIDFSKAYGKYALRSNGIRTTGDALSMLWTVANNSMSGDASLALAATSIAADVAPLLLNKYLGSDSPVTTALTEAAKNYNGGTVLSSWQDGVLTDTGTPLYVLPPRDTGRTLSEIPVSAYQNTPAPGGNGGSSPQFVFAPNITITGDADRQQIASIMEDEYEKFKAFMDKYNRENNRTRYA
ncbi:phage tail tape measure protein [Faecalibacterium prausnitzii]|uniref:Phage tail tape measure protein n=2 Tax=Faecalibacterium prausnitzii TaxID=853 RepID=A0A6A8KFK9_9FIRM|nr:phage tail tape measure protein [Faecalibacterium prausnitzii]MSC49420.1 phage tail tape measure protein [Faecalibacterium prausnitzii]MSC69537.1 phage tail tape measure protein [Faecalibacterium prausnitzii]MSC74333.1 phage tail tape measure protein [Faecalibacterium prausnitzii]MSC81889.1 phage tail tape measure protein [Faecalibacterium prausnitzii]